MCRAQWSVADGGGSQHSKGMEGWTEPTELITNPTLMLAQNACCSFKYSCITTDWINAECNVHMDLLCPAICLLTFRKHVARWKVNNTLNPPGRQGLAVSLDIMGSDGFTHETRGIHIRIWVVLMRFNLRSDSCSSCSYDPRRDLRGSSLFSGCLWFIYYEVSLQHGRGKHPLCSWN